MCPKSPSSVFGSELGQDADVHDVLVYDSNDAVPAYGLFWPDGQRGEIVERSSC